MAELLETLQDEFNSVYLKENEQNSVLAIQKMTNDKINIGELLANFNF